MKEVKKYSEEDIEFLKENYGIKKVKEIAMKLNRNEKAIINKAYKLGIGKKNLTQDQLNKIKTEYKSYNIEELSKELGITKHHLSKRAKELCVKKTNKKQKYTKKEFNKVSDKTNIQYIKSLKRSIASSEITKKQIVENGHPRGMLGKNHTEQTKQINSLLSKKMWSDPNSKVHSEEIKQRKSDFMMEMQKNKKLRNGYSRGKQGKREDLNNVFFRSSWEANYARYLNLLISQKQLYKWEFEPDTFWFKEIKRGTRSYLPDFKIWETENSIPYYVEVKGWMDDKSRTKLKRMAKYYPDIEVRLIEKNEYNEIKRKVAPFIKTWE